MKIGTRLTLGFIVIFLMLMSLAFIGINRMELLSNQSFLMYNHPLTVSNSVLRINTSLIKIHREMKDIVLLENMEDMKEHSQHVNDYEQQIFNDFEIINEHFLGDKEKYSIALREFTEWKTIRDEVIELMMHGKRKEAIAITTEKGALHVLMVEEAIEELGDFAQNKAKEFLHSAKATKLNAFNMMYVLIGIAILVVIVLAIFLTRSITRPIELMRTATDKIGKGEFTTKINLDSKDELSHLATSFNKMAIDLKNITASRDELDKEIIERKKVEEELYLQSEIVRNVNEGIYIVGEDDGIIKYTNPEFEKMFGYNQGEMIGKKVSIVNASTEKTPEETKSEIMEVLINAGEWHGEVKNIKKDGTHFWSYANVILFNSSKFGKVLVSAHTDISELKKTEENLEEESYLRGILLDNLPCVAMILKKGTREIVASNKTARKVGAVPGKTCYETCAMRSSSCPFCLAPELWKDGKPKHIETEKDGTYYEGYWAPYSEDLYVHYIFDISVRKKAEKERGLLNLEVKQKNKELEQIIYVASHDLRSPLVNVEGYNKIIGSAIGEITSVLESGEVSEEIRNKVSAIVKEDIVNSEKYISASVSKMNVLISGLLQLSRLGKIEMKKERLDMNDIISDVTTTMKYQLQQAEAKLDVSELPSCIGDKIQITQLFSNLLDNSMKFFYPKRQGIINISGNTQNNHSVYQIEDNGIGIAPEHYGRIFEIFHKLSPDMDGEGIGLSIVQRIIDRHKGKILVESEKGKGSKFFIYLPTS